MGEVSHISDYHLLPAARSKARDDAMIFLTSLVAASSPIPLLAPVKTTVLLAPTPFATVGPARSAAKAAPAAVFPKPALVTKISSPPSMPLLLLLVMLEKSAVSADTAVFPRAAVEERGLCERVEYGEGERGVGRAGYCVCAQCPALRKNAVTSFTRTVPSLPPSPAPFPFSFFQSFTSLSGDGAFNVT